MAVYVIDRGDGSTGMVRGVDFFQGRGTTSCLSDVRAFLEMGFRVSELGTGRPVAIEVERHPTAHVEVLKVVPAPAQATSAAEEAPAGAPSADSPASSPGPAPEGAPARKPAPKRAATRRAKKG